MASELARLLLLHQKMLVLLSYGFINQTKLCQSYPVSDLLHPGVVMIKTFLRPVTMIPTFLRPFAIDHGQSRLLAVNKGVLNVLLGG